MKIIITQWAFNAYLELKHDDVISDAFYTERLRPDAMRLQHYPADPKFDNGKFWSPAQCNNALIPYGFKMKWHQVGNGCVQLRLPVSIRKEAFLCQGYVKHNEKTEKRLLAKFKTHSQLIEEGRFIKCGELT